MIISDEPSRDELEFAKALWLSTRQLSGEGEPYGKHMWGILNRYYPGRQGKQVRVLGFLDEVDEVYGGSVPEAKAQLLASKWGVEDLLLKERGFGTITLS